jgi:hypothetical protein
LETPIAFARPSARIAARPRSASESSSSGLGQWIRRRSTWGVARRSSEASKARRIAAPFGLSFQTLVVRKISSRPTPDAARAAPTASSLPYISAVSMWR